MDLKSILNYQKKDAELIKLEKQLNSNENKKIAPGTTGLITLNLSGQCETAFNLTIDLTETYSDNWKKSATGPVYHPITLTAKSTIDGASVNIVGNKINVKNFEAGETLSGTISITWAWAFEGDDAADSYMSTLDATYSLAALATATQIN